MPHYDYECTKCRRKFEIEQKISDKPRQRCPYCRSKVFRVITGGGGVILKGSGFYVTDYRSAAYKKAAANDKAPTPAPKETKKKASTGS